jgi:hypothetical protein
MNSFVLSMIAIVTTFGYLAQVNLLPRVAKFLPEIITAITLLLVVTYGARNRFQFVRPAYWFVFGAAAVTFACGAVANALEAGPLIAGMRNYLRAAPLFFLPAVYAFSERQIRSQLSLLVVLCLVQLPIAMHQRISGGGATGDRTVGTLMVSGFLTIFMVCAICVLTAAFLRKQIRLQNFLLLFLLMLAPTTINETKATVLFLPIGLLITFIAGSQRGARLKNALVATNLLIIAGAIFVPIYDYYASHAKYGTPIVEFFTERAKFERYVSKDAEIGTRRVEEVGRSDAILIPLKEMARDPTHLAFGLGIGNASQSSLGSNFSGKYFRKFEPFHRSAASNFILEIGLLGLTWVLLLNYLIYKDSRAVAELDQRVIGTLAVGWAGVTAVITLGVFYAPIVTSEPLSYLFWYFSGVVAAQRVRLSRQSL